jgi:hypothetical protein
MKTLILLFLSLNAYADQWFCTDEASSRSNNIIKSCGIGQAATEESARAKAFENARLEFRQVCNSSSDCIGRFIYSKPLRTECSQDSDGYKCYRMVQFRIGDPAPVASAHPGASVSAIDAFWNQWEIKYLKSY